MTRATRNLPDGYRRSREINLAKQKGTALGLNIAGLALFFLTAAALSAFVRWARPDLSGSILVVLDGKSLAWQLAGVLGLLFGNLIVHELIHGLFFWWFTRDAPRFALKLTYAYAAAPQWYLPRREYLLVGLAPLVLIDLACVLLIAAGPPGWALPAALAAAFNTSGAVGDLLIVWWVGRSAADCLVNDQGDGVTIYERGEKAQTA